MVKLSKDFEIEQLEFDVRCLFDKFLEWAWGWEYAKFNQWLTTRDRRSHMENS